MATNFNHAEDQRKKNSWYLGLFGGIVFGAGTVFGMWKSMWFFGLCPSWYSKNNGHFYAIHGTISYFIHFIDPDYLGDLHRTWADFSASLVQTHSLESFLATIWGPIITGAIVFFSVWIWLYRMLSGSNDSAGYIRGSRIKSK